MKKKNKLRFLSYALSLSLSTMALNACSGDFSYSSDDKGEIIVEGNITYNILKDYKLIELKLLNGENKLYITKKDTYYQRTNITHHDYSDIFSGKSVYVLPVWDYSGPESNIQLLNEYNIEDYLITYDEVKDNYTIEDIERIYDKIVADYEFETENELKK